MSSTQKKVLFVTRIGGFLNPGNGGQLRTHHMLRILAKQCDVDLFNPGMQTQATAAKAWNELQLGKLITPHWLRTLTRLRLRRGWHRAIHTLEKWIFKPSPYIAHVDVATWWINRFVLSDAEYELIILDTLSLPPLISWQATHRQTWLNAHNVESILEPTNQHVLSLESNLSTLLDGIISCTQQDLKRFNNLNQHPLNSVIWPNGAKAPPKFLKPPSDQSALFIGSLDYAPNRVGLDWYFSEIHHLIISELPQYQLNIIGRNPQENDFNKWSNQPNTTVISDVPSITPFLIQSKISIVPLLSGSGSRLKIADSLIHGRPVVSTTIGAEGYAEEIPGLELTDNPSEFAQIICALLKSSNTEQCIQIYNYATNNLSWTACIQIDQLFNQNDKS